MLCLVVSLIVMLIVAAPVYASENPTELTVRQTFVTSSASRTADTFTYKLQIIASDDPEHLKDLDFGAGGYTFKISGNDTFKLGPLSYSQPGVYRYELYQVIPSDRQGYLYDERVYKIEAHVSASLDVDFIVRNEEGLKTSSIEFHNEYHTKATDFNLMTDPAIVKTVSGNPSAASTFSFSLVAHDSSYPMPAGSTDGVKTIQITGSGKAAFGKWSYQEAGLYTYTVFEERGVEKGYTYDAAVYTITDTVTEVGAQLVLSRVVTNSTNKRVTSCSFINKYTSDPLDNPTNPGSPVTPGTSSDGPKMGPKTGDSINIGLHKALLACGGVMAAIATLYLIRDRRGEKREKA